MEFVELILIVTEISNRFLVLFFTAVVVENPYLHK